MPSDVLSKEPSKSKTGETDPSGSKDAIKPDVRKKIEWLKEFTKSGEEADKKAKKDKLRSEAIGSATINLKLGTEGLAGLDFKMLVKKDSSLKSKAMALVGKQDTMSSLTGTGDAMNEIDTVHDIDKLEAIPQKTLNQAFDSLKLVADASQALDRKMVLLYAEECGIELSDPPTPAQEGQLERLTQALDQKKRDMADPKKRKEIETKEKERAKQKEEDKKAGKKPTKEEIEQEKAEAAFKKELAKFEKLRDKVDKEVREEVWQPLVRQGLIPENFVPDKHSEVARTFEGASDAYNKRLEEYTKSLGEHGETIEKLGLAKKIVDQTSTVMTSVLEAIPGANGVTGAIKTGVECATLLADTSMQVAGQVLKKDDAVSIAGSVVQGIQGILGATGQVPPEVLTCVDAGMQIALTGGKVIKGIMDGKPGDIVSSVLSGITQSLTLAGQVSGNPTVAMLGTDAAAAAFTMQKAGPLVQALAAKPPDPDVVKAALADFISTGLKEVATAVDEAITLEAAKGKISQSDSTTITNAVNVGTDTIGELAGVVLAKNKAAALSKAIGVIADDCCSAYIPGDYGSMIGGIIKKSLAKAPDLVEGLRDGDPKKALDAFSSVLATSLKKASNVQGMDPSLAEGLGDAAIAIKGLKSEVKGLADFKKAVEDGNVAGVRKAATKIVNTLMDPILANVDPTALDSDGNLVADDGDEAPETEDEGVDPDSELGQEMQEDFEAKRRKVMATADKIIKDPKSTKEEIEKAQKTRDEAVTELLQRNAFMEEVAASAKDFEEMLNSDLSGEGPDDDGDTRTLEKLITTIQRDRLIMQMADSLISMGVGVAAHFFPPMGIAMDLKTFAVEASKAVAHMQQLRVWMKNAKEARNAVTVQVHSMLNRVGLEEEAVIEHQIKATLALISAIGNIVATAGAHAAPAGIAITAAAKAASASLELALTIKSAAEMEVAWNKYKKALSNPRDRKNVRMAIQGNASLAKYALVWGALNDGNPIAKKALKRCGLTDNIIAKEQANVKGVVQYLEVLYNDDPIVLKAVPDTSGWGWEAPRPKLTLRDWTNFLAIAQTKGAPKLKSGTGGAITAAFAPIDKAKAELAKAQATYERCSAAVEKLKGAMTTEEVEATIPKKEKMNEEEMQALQKEVEELKEDNKKRLEKPLANLEHAASVVEAKKAELQKALDGIAKACNGFKPLDEKDKPYPRISEWVGALSALAVLEGKELKGEDVGLDL
jgi:hypothetical protein